MLWSAGTFVHYAPISFVWSLGGHDVGTSAIAGIYHLHRGQLFQKLLIYVSALALPYGVSVPCQTKPLKVVHQLERVFLFAALRVKVLYAKNPFASLALGGKP
jgi:hypothetical protein